MLYFFFFALFGRSLFSFIDTAFSFFEEARMQSCNPCNPLLGSREDVSLQHRYDIMQTTILSICSSFLFYFQLYPIIQNIVFKFLSVTFSFCSSCYFSLVLAWLISISIHFCCLPFILLYLYTFFSSSAFWIMLCFLF